MIQEDRTIYERDIPFRIKSESKDGNVILHQEEEMFTVKITESMAKHGVVGVIVEVISQIDVVVSYIGLLSLPDQSDHY